MQNDNTLTILLALAVAYLFAKDRGLIAGSVKAKEPEKTQEIYITNPYPYLPYYGGGNRHRSHHHHHP